MKKRDFTLAKRIIYVRTKDLRFHKKRLHKKKRKLVKMYIKKGKYDLADGKHLEKLSSSWDIA